ncbi:tetratricopeptide repeat protein [Sulfuricurvum sp.]|uniref:tetratricopeptide repeat protein n=1 Tax=Sulfuricurvum sp. TaxID=2025608 RepID=UPI003562C9FA
MNFLFVHPEFFFWMLPPIIVLFYFWYTQKGVENTLFTLQALERLRAPAITMGLQGRNSLFFMASMLLITAMAEPVLIETPPDSRGNVILAMDISRQSIDSFEYEKEAVLALIRGLKEENIGVVAYDKIGYRIAPISADHVTISALIEGLHTDVIHPYGSDPQAMIKSLIRTKYTDDSIVLVLISSHPLSAIYGGKGIAVVAIEKGKPIGEILKLIRNAEVKNRLVAQVPLFYYPLGLAMLLIWMALSSMSKRRSVPLISAMLLFVAIPSQNHAGVVDFRVLNEASTLYAQGSYSESAELFAIYQKIHDTPQVRYNRANALFKAGKYEEARTWYERVYTRDPKLSEYTRYNLACTMAIIEQQEPQKRVENSKERGNAISREKRGENTPKTHLYRMDY